MLTRAFLIDAAERVALTFLESFVGALLVATQVDLSTAKAAAIAGLGAALALAKTIIAGKVGGTVSPASLAKVPTGDAGSSPVGVVLAVVVALIVLALFGAYHAPLLLLLLIVAVLLLLF